MTTNADRNLSPCGKPLCHGQKIEYLLNLDTKISISFTNERPTMKTRSTRSYAPAVLALTASLLLAACGGGGGGTSSEVGGPPTNPITAADYELPKAIATVPDQSGR